MSVLLQVEVRFIHSISLSYTFYFTLFHFIPHTPYIHTFTHSHIHTSTHLHTHTSTPSSGSVCFVFFFLRSFFMLWFVIQLKCSFIQNGSACTFLNPKLKILIYLFFWGVWTCEDVVSSSSSLSDSDDDSSMDSDDDSSMSNDHTEWTGTDDVDWKHSEFSDSIHPTQHNTTQHKKQNYTSIQKFFFQQDLLSFVVDWYKLQLIFCTSILCVCEWYFTFYVLVEGRSKRTEPILKSPNLSDCSPFDFCVFLSSCVNENYITSSLLIKPWPTLLLILTLPQKVSFVEIQSVWFFLSCFKFAF
jgi:hypothetical protein